MKIPLREWNLHPILSEFFHDGAVDFGLDLPAALRISHPG
jgi:hypothetical protein